MGIVPITISQKVLASAFFIVRNKIGFKQAFKHFPEFFGKVNHNRKNRTDMDGNV